MIKLTLFLSTFLGFVNVVFAQTSQPTAQAIAASPQQAWWQALLVGFIDVAIAFFVPVLSYLAYKLLNKWSIKADLESLEAIANKAVDFANTKAKTALGDNLPKQEAAKRLAQAFEIGDKLIKQYKLDKKASDKLKDLIEDLFDTKEEKLKEKSEELKK